MGLLKSLATRVLPESALMHARALDHYLNGEVEIRLVDKLCPRGREAVDAGANIGTYSYFLRRRASKVHAFEPNPGLAQKLARLMPDVDVRNQALSDVARQVVLKVPVDAQGRPSHELASIAQEFEGQVQDFVVQATTVDQEAFSDVGFLKVDVEQHERQVLKGSMQTIKRCRPVVMTEATPLKYEADVPTVFSFLTDEGYVGWFKFQRQWLPFSSYVSNIHANEDNYNKGGPFVGNNLIFIPKEHPLAATGPAA